MVHITELGNANGVTSIAEEEPLPDRTNPNGVNSNTTAIMNPEDTSSESVQKRSSTEPIDSEADKITQTVADADRNGADPAEFDEDQGGQTGTDVGKKKKKSKKSKSKRGLNAPTGFEEYYVDAPLTPAEFEEEKQIYDPSYRFTQRIETAIQRFTAKRKLDPAAKTLFDRYLVHGGVEGGPKMFGGGLDAETLGTRNAAEIAELAATHYVGSDKADAFDATYVVDFEGCLKSFLSGPFPTRWDLTSKEQVKKLIGILRNFFNYLLHHDVCPEYNGQVKAARTLCDKSVEELWNLTEINSLLPGDFNMACSEIFGGTYQGVYSSTRSWMEDADNMANIGISPERARHAFKIGIAANASDEMFPIYRQQLAAKECKVISTEDTVFEITEIIPASQTAINLYGQQQSAGLKTLGKMKAKTWFNPNAPEDDLTEKEEASLKANPPQIKMYEFWLEEDILEKCEVGMKLEATVRETSFGLTFFDAINGVLCSFYQSIPNELMEDWKEIEKEWLPHKDNKHIAAKKAASKSSDRQDADGNQGTDKDHEEEPSGSRETNEEVHQLEGDSEEGNVNPNIVAAGYDDEDFEKHSSEAQSQSSEKKLTAGFGVEVHKSGEELKEVSGNADTVLQEYSDVKRVEDVE